MKKRIAVVGNVDDSLWLQKVEAPLATLGEVTTFSQDKVDYLEGYLGSELIIVDTSGIQNAVEFVKYLKDENFTTPLLVVTASPTWRRAREMFKAGATDYLKQTDTEKIVAVSKRTLYKERILLADNHLDFLDVMTEYFQNKGHIVLRAETPERAQTLLLDRPPEIAIIDFRLRNDQDPRDKSGLDLVLRLYKYIQTKFIVLTRENPPAKEILPVLVPDAENRRPAVNFVLKNDGFDALYEAVDLLCNIDFEYLASRIMQHFNQDELKRFCYYELEEMDYQELEGNIKKAKVMALIQYQSRRGRVRDLVKKLSKRRPNVDFIGAKSE